jgi:hypothetical protein
MSHSPLDARARANGKFLWAASEILIRGRHWAGTPGRGVPVGFVRNGTSTLKK